MSSPIAEMWAGSQVLMNRAAVGRLSLVSDAKSICRADVVSNADVIIPIMKFMGTRVTVANIKAEVDLFFAFARPRGKPPLSSSSVE